jgi:hypothetical protein
VTRMAHGNSVISAVGPVPTCATAAVRLLPDAPRCALQSMAWLGQRLVACTTLEYLLLDVAADAATPLFSLPAEAPPPTLIHRLPGSTLLALLLMVPPHSAWSGAGPGAPARPLLKQVLQL